MRKIFQNIVLNETQNDLYLLYYTISQVLNALLVVAFLAQKAMRCPTAAKERSEAEIPKATS